MKGFLLAYLGLTRTYIIYPEYEANKGYADFYMMPDLIHQPEIGFSYIVEVKYARRDASETEIEALRAEAAIQLRRYAADPEVHATKGIRSFVLSPWSLRVGSLLFARWTWLDFVFMLFLMVDNNTFNHQKRRYEQEKE